MLKNISEKEFIEIIGYRSYLHFCKTTFNKIRQSKEFKEFKQSKGSLFFTSMFFCFNIFYKNSLFISLLVF